jgi:hypothetical protein
MRHQYLCWPGLPDERQLRVGDWRVRFRDDHPTRPLEVLRILSREQAYRSGMEVNFTALYCSQPLTRSASTTRRNSLPDCFKLLLAKEGS